MLRQAVAEDVAAMVALLADDQRGAARDGPAVASTPAPYLRAFEAIDADLAHLLLVAVVDGDVVATMQQRFLPGLARRGALRA